MQDSTKLEDYRTETCYRPCAGHAVFWDGRFDIEPHNHPQRIPVGMPGPTYLDILQHRVVRAKFTFASWAAKKLVANIYRTFKVAKWQGLRETGHITSYDDVMAYVREEKPMKAHLRKMGVHTLLLDATWKMAIAGLETKLKTPRARKQA